MQKKQIKYTFSNIITKYKGGIIAFLSILFISITLNVTAAPDHELTYHGKLTDTSDVSVADGNLDFTLTIYDAESGGTCLWSARGTCGAPTSKQVAIENGIFSTTLGESADNTLSSLNFDDNYYLDVKIGSNPSMTPRRKITPTSFALNSYRLNGLTADNYIDTSATDQLKQGGLDVGGIFSVNTNDFYVDTGSGRVGVGTSTVLEELTVDGAINLGTTTATNEGTIRYLSNDFEGYDGTSWKSLTASGGSTTFLGLSDTPAAYTAGSLLFTSGSAVTEDNSNLFWDDTNKRLGIGTAVPSSRLTVSDNGFVGNYIAEFHADDEAPWVAGFFNDTYSTTVPVFEYYGYNTGGFTMGTHDARNLSFYTGGYTQTRMLIDSVGNVGIGNTTPSHKLDITGTGRFTDALTVGAYTLLNTDGTSGQVLKTDGLGGLTWQDDNEGANIATFLGLTDTPAAYTAGSLLFTSGSAVTEDNSNLFWDDTDKRLGIGTSTPTNKISIYDATQAALLTYGYSSTDAAANVASGEILIGNLVDYQGQISYQSASGNLYIRNTWDNDAGDIQFQTKINGTKVDAMTITGNGNLGVNIISPNERLQVNGAINLGTTTATNEGTIRYLSNDFEGYDGTSWKSLTDNSGTPAGASGAIQFNNAGAFGADNTNLFWDDANNRLGVGTNSPNAQLHISGNGILERDDYTQLSLRTHTGAGAWRGSYLRLHRTRGTAVAPAAVQNGDMIGIVDFWGHDGTNNDRASQIISSVEGAVSTGIIPTNMQFRTTDTAGALNTVLYLNRAGNVGINTTSPSGRLDIVQSVDTTNGGIVVRDTASSGALRLWTDANGLGRLSAGLNENTNILLNGGGAGNVGIGTVTPTNLLDINTASVSAGISLDGRRSITGYDGGGWLRLNQGNDWASGVYTPGVFRADGGIRVDNRAMISSNGTVHTARSTNDDHYGYFEVRDDAGNRGAYLGYGDPGNYVNLQMENGNNLVIMGGDVGIGTSTPSSILHIDAGAGNTNAQLTFEGDDNAGDDDIIGSLLFKKHYGVNDGASIYAIGSGNSTAYQQADIRFATNMSSGLTDRMAITGTGVGIGTNTPSSPLNVIGAGRFGRAGSTQQYLEMIDDSATGARIISHSAEGNKKVMLFENLHDAAGSASGAQDFIFRVGDESAPTELVRLLENGNLGLGTSSPDYKLQVDGIIAPESDDTYDLGTSTLRWQDLYLGPASLHIGVDGDEGVISYDTSNNTFNFDVNGDATNEFSISDSGNLNITGSIQLTNDTDACSASKEGTMRYNDTTKVMEFCNGTDWGMLGSGSGSGSSSSDYHLVSGGWEDAGSTLPTSLVYSQTAVIGDYVYLFGGNNGSVANIIYRAPTSDPTNWTNTGSTLPVDLTHSQTAVVGDYVYLFGGYNGSTWTNVIYRAPTSDPTNWTDTGSVLPGNLSDSQTAVIGDHVYLFGGYDGSATVNVIYRAPTSDPTSWTNTGNVLPNNLINSQTAVIGDYVYLFGGHNGSAYTNIIYRAPTSDPTNWTDTGSVLPGNSTHSQVAVIGEHVYLFGGFNGSAHTKIIYHAPTSDPTNWTDTGSVLPGNLSLSQMAVIGDHVYLFGGHDGSAKNVIYRAPIGSSTSLADNKDWKVKYGASGSGSSSSLPTCTNGQTLSYNATSSEWECADASSGGNGNTPTFSAHRNSSNQSVSSDTWTKVDWTTEDFDTASNFDLATDRFTPTTAGKYIFNLRGYCLNSSRCMISLRKNGTPFYNDNGSGANTSGHSGGQLSGIIDMNGTTDYVEVYIHTAGTVIIGDQRDTYFTGSRIDVGGSSSSLPTCTDGQTISYNATSSEWECADIGEDPKYGYDNSGITADTTSTSAIFTGSDLSADIDVKTGDVVKVDLSCNMRNIGGGTVYMRPRLFSGSATDLFPASNYITVATEHWSGGSSSGYYEATADGILTFQGRWHVGSGTGYYVYCNIGAHVIGSGGSVTSPWTKSGSDIYYNTGNVAIGSTNYGTNANNILTISNSTAPTSSITDGIQLFAVDQGGSHELRVRDEAGNTTTLSPHNFSNIPGGQSEELAWSYYSEKDNKSINVDMTKAMRLVEQLTGQQLIYITDKTTGQEIPNLNLTSINNIPNQITDINTQLSSTTEILQQVQSDMINLDDINNQFTDIEDNLETLEQKIDANTNINITQEISDRLDTLEQGLNLVTQIDTRILTINPNTLSFISEEGILQQSIMIEDENGEMIEQLNDTTTLTLNGLLNTKKIITQELQTNTLTINDDVTVEDEDGEDINASSIGTATIIAGDTEVVVETDVIVSGARVFVTPISDLADSVFHVEKDFENNSFKIVIDPSINDEDALFDWFVVNGLE